MKFTNKIFDIFNNILNYLRLLYTKGDLFRLFLVSAFFQHAWALFLSFRDFDWVAERTNSWDAVGNISYALFWSFFDSLLLFIFILILSIFVHKVFSIKIRFTIMSLIALFTSIWFIFDQTFYLLGGKLPDSIIKSLSNSEHPYRILFGVILILVVTSYLIPIYFIIRSEKFTNAMNSLLERIILLSGLYLFLDIVGLGIIIYRNMKGA